MAQYNITVDDEVLKGLFTGDKGMSQLLEWELLRFASHGCATAIFPQNSLHAISAVSRLCCWRWWRW